MTDIQTKMLLDAQDESRTLKANIKAFLENMVRPAKCPRGCGAEVFWMVHRTGANTPYNPDLSNHLATCARIVRFNGDVEIAKRREVANAGAPD